jgi:hypothetical protein
MSDERKPETPTQQFPLQVQSPNFRVIYANGFAYKPTYSDFGLTAIVQVSYIQNVEGNVITNNVSLQEVMIMLSLAGAKSLGRNLTKIITEVEKQIGPIKITKQSIISDEALKSISDEINAMEFEQD